MAPRWIRWTAPLFVLACLAGPAFADGHPGRTDVFATEAAFAGAEAEGVHYDAGFGGFRLQPDRSSGVLTLTLTAYHVNFSTVVPSWNADCPPGTWVEVELQASTDGGRSWSGWFDMAAWGDPAVLARRPKGGSLGADALARVDVDTLLLKQPANALRYRLSLHTERPDASPVVSLAAVSVIDAGRTLPPDDSPGLAWGRELAVEFRSQSRLPKDISYRGCGPTALAMALSAHGASLPTEHVAKACWDGRNGLYGNWAFLAAAASRLLREAHPGGGQAFVSWAPDWKDVEQEILAGHPVVVSIYFGKGELKGSMTEASEGHLLLVRGFTKTGDVVCADPAARTEARGLVVYDRQELHRARHGGPIIVLRPTD